MATNRALPSLGMQLGWGCYATLEGSGHQLMPCPRPSSVHAESVITAHAIHTANSRPECWADIAGAVSLSDDSGSMPAPLEPVGRLRPSRVPVPSRSMVGAGASIPMIQLIAAQMARARPDGDMGERR